MCVKGEYMYVRGECVCERARMNYVLYGPSYCCVKTPCGILGVRHKIQFKSVCS